MLLTERLLNKARRTARYKGYRRKRAFLILGKEDEKMEKKTKELQALCEPLIKYLKENYDPHANIIVSDGDIKLVRTEIGIPAENDSFIDCEHILIKGGKSEMETLLKNATRDELIEELNMRESITHICVGKEEGANIITSCGRTAIAGHCHIYVVENGKTDAE